MAGELGFVLSHPSLEKRRRIGHPHWWEDKGGAPGCPPIQNTRGGQSALGLVSRCMADRKHAGTCWAASLGDCGGRVSGEHYVSACLFPSGSVIVKGFPWCREEPKTIGLQSLTRNLLCRQHNSRLSDLDSAMLNVFNTLRESGRLNNLRSGLRQGSWDIKHFELSSTLVERWFLKTLINFSFGKELRYGDAEGAHGVPPKELVEIAFGLAGFEGLAGMYIAICPGERVTMLESVSIAMFTEGDALVCAEFSICGFRFVLSLVQEEVHEFQGSQLSHKKINFNFRVPDTNGEMVLSHSLHIR